MSDKDYNLQVRLSGAERAAFEEAARAAGISISGWVRERLRRAARERRQSLSPWADTASAVARVLAAAQR